MIIFKNMSLHKDKSFAALLAADFLGAFNDNAFKILVSFYLLDRAANSSSGALLLSAAGFLFVLPFLLFSTYAGYVADRFSKKQVIIAMKVIETVLMLVGVWSIIHAHVPLLLVLLFFMGVHSAFYGPAKYGIIPEVVRHEELSQANGWVQMVTYAGIILGQAVGAFLTVNGNGMALSGYLFLAVAILGSLSAIFIKSVHPASINRPFLWNMVHEIKENLTVIHANRALRLSTLGLAYFSLLGALFQLNIMVYAREHLALDNGSASILMMILAFGIAFGGVFAGRVSDQKIELGIVPLGAMGLTCMSMILGMWPKHLELIVPALFCLGFSAGFYTVPINALIQHQSLPEKRGQLLAANSFISFFAVLIGTGLFYLLHGLCHLSPAMIFVFCSKATLIGAFIAIRIMPYALIRLLVWTLTHTFYRVRLDGAKNFPKEGGALIVANHISFIDGIFLTIACERPVRFVMSRDMYMWKPIHWLCKIARSIPIEKGDSPKELVKALQAARDAVRQGELVCIFPEGTLTRTGNTLKFNKGVEFIMKGLTEPIIPVHLDRIWGSVFSFRGGKFFAQWPRVIPYPVTITVGEPVSATTSSFELRQIVTNLGVGAFHYRLNPKKTLSELFMDQMRRRPFAFAIADSTGKKLNALMVAIMSLALRKTLARHSQEGEMIGVLLPPSIAGVLVNVSLGMIERVAVNINYTQSSQAMASILQQTQMKQIITSRQFLEKLNIQLNVKMIYVEDLLKEISIGDYAKAFFLSLICPRFLSHRIIFGFSQQQKIQQLATVMFTSGSTGNPKGVELTQANIISNIEGLYQLLEVSESDKILGILPFFHSFGFTATLWFPLIGGMGAVYHYNPLDAKTVGKMVQENSVTLMMTTPTFLSSYTKRCEKEQFQSLRLVVVGAEKLKAPIAEAFDEKFGIMPMEGYGCTELSPIASVNLPDINFKTIHQKAHKFGTIGKALPGVAVKVVDVNSGAILGPGMQGLLMVKGPNVMKGYLNQPEKTQEVIVDGWYRTGDIAFIDEDGFITITDRLSRFSKIAGEMVPHIKVEEAIQEAMGVIEQSCVVMGIPDEKKGEQLVVVYVGEKDINQIISILKERGLPNLWIPSVDQFIKIDTLPLLGTGKLDFVAIKQIVKDRQQNNN